MNLQELPLDPNKLLNRVGQLDPNLLQRVIAEEQRDQLAQYINQQAAEAAEVDEIEEDEDE